MTGRNASETRRPQRVVLIGPIQQENLALQYLAAAARAAGHEASVVAYADRSELGAALEQTLRQRPDMVGLGIAFQNNIDDYLALMLALRQRGFAGHLTCGGHVPTFCYQELLADIAGLDTVVRHDGEQTLVDMLERLAAGLPIRDIPGLVWRQADGGICVGPLRPPVPDLDSLPWPGRSESSYSVGGFGVDFVITARGCVGECNYCSIAAYTQEQKKRYRLRRAEAVAEEVAALYHERAARVIFVQDDLFVLPSEARTVERVQRLTYALRSAGVHDAVFWVKGRPETITPRVCEALVEMGVIHMFLGVESAAPERLEYLGRSHQPEDNHRAISHCRDAGIVPSFNFMLFDPDCTLDEVEQTLQLGDLHVDLPWNVCRTEVYSGTALSRRLAAEGRLEGNYRSFGYLMRDPRAEVLFRILRVSLHERALAIESLLNRLISLSFARQLHERYFPGKTSEALARRVTELSVEARRDTIRAIREALAFVQDVDLSDARMVQRFAIDQAFAVNAADAERRRATEEMWQHLHLRGATLMTRRGVALSGSGRSHWSVAAGS
ncbi:MAG TPA: radical SAM protein [Polyangiaceae bacterium]|nr:radical SAM protein [Polyangiaceae bacterium]